MWQYQRRLKILPLFSTYICLPIKWPFYQQYTFYQQPCCQVFNNWGIIKTWRNQQLIKNLIKINRKIKVFLSDGFINTSLQGERFLPSRHIFSKKRRNLHLQFQSYQVSYCGNGGCSHRIGGSCSYNTAMECKVITGYLYKDNKFLLYYCCYDQIRP